jgi:hypothetical protein
MDQRIILRDLVEFKRPLDDILLDLKRLKWDNEVPLVILEQSHLASVLRRYLDGELSSEAVGTWADAIEMRGRHWLRVRNHHRTSIARIGKPAFVAAADKRTCSRIVGSNFLTNPKVRYGSQAEIRSARQHVGFVPNSEVARAALA